MWIIEDTKTFEFSGMAKSYHTALHRNSGERDKAKLTFFDKTGEINLTCIFNETKYKTHIDERNNLYNVVLQSLMDECPYFDLREYRNTSHGNETRDGR